MLVMTNLAAGTAALAVALVRPADPPPLVPDSEIPGGYLDSEDLRGTEPDDGHNQVTLGSILFSLGGLRLGSAVFGFISASPAYCAQVYGNSASDDTCKGLQIFGITGMAFGALTMGTGIGILAMGLVKRQRHRQWLFERGMSIGPWSGPQHHGVAIGLRF
jgi:hypothetical protein